MIQEADWAISANVDTDLARFLEGFDAMFFSNFNNKAYEFIKKTKSYKKLLILQNVLKKDTSTKNTLKDYELSNIQKYLPDIINKKVTSIITSNILSDKLKKLFWLFENGQSRRGSYFSKKRKEWVDRDEIFVYKTISKKNRLEVLRLLKGDI